MTNCYSCWNWYSVCEVGWSDLIHFSDLRKKAKENILLMQPLKMLNSHLFAASFREQSKFSEVLRRAKSNTVLGINSYFPRYSSFDKCLQCVFQYEILDWGPITMKCVQFFSLKNHSTLAWRTWAFFLAVCVWVLLNPDGIKINEAGWTIWTRWWSVSGLIPCCTERIRWQATPGPSLTSVLINHHRPPFSSTISNNHGKW